MPELQLEVFDRSNWRQAFTLQKALVHIGSGPQNDVVLDPNRGSGVAPRHLQLLAVPGRVAPRLVNLGDNVTVAGAHGERLVAPRAVVDLAAGDRIRVGEFTLIVSPATPGGDRRYTAGAAADGPATAPGGFPGANGSSNPPPSGSTGTGLGLALKLPNTTLTLDQPLEGVLVVQNRGDRAGVQFRIAVEGLPPDCFEVGPAPILFPNAQKEVLFRLRHPRGPGLLAGRQRFRVVATAPESYPGETAAALQTVNVQVYHQHEVRLTPLD